MGLCFVLFLLWSRRGRSHRNPPLIDVDHGFTAIDSASVSSTARMQGFPGARFVRVADAAPGCCELIPGLLCLTSSFCRKFGFDQMVKPRLGCFCALSEPKVRFIVQGGVTFRCFAETEEVGGSNPIVATIEA